MRLGLIADTHGKVRAEVHEVFRKVDLILHAGDLGGADVLEELELLAKVVAVYGNVDNYLHEAALAHRPPSKTVYKSSGDGVAPACLGAHEHWNNPTDKQYSRNLGKRKGIELVRIGAAGK